MRRRLLLATLPTAALALTALAQSRPTVRLGVVSFGERADRVDGYTALFERLAELGYVEGRNLQVDFTGNVKPEGLSNAFTGAVRRGATMLFASGHDITLLSAKIAAAGRVPVVFIAMDYDPVRLGYVPSIAHPGANLTGVFVRQPELAAKRVELAHEALPHVRRLALWGTPNYSEQVEAAASAARTLGLETSQVEMNGNPGQSYVPIFLMTTAASAGAVILPASNQVRAARAEICRLALAQGIPLIAAERELVDAGVLMSYGARIDSAYREAADYIDRIARGEKAGDLPLQQPTRFELVINLRTAKALGVSLPSALLARADEVIE
jgi:putative ABC transport system substrate-binding protein